MGGAGLSDFLPDFSEDVRARSSGRGTPFSLFFEGKRRGGGPAARAAFTPLEPVEPPPAGGEEPGIADAAVATGDVEATIEQAHDSKWEEIEKLTRSHEAEIEALGHAHEDALQARAAELEAGALRSLAGRLAALEDGIAETVIGQVAETLKTILGLRIEQDTIRELCEALRPVLRDAGVGAVEISGPKLLLDKLRLHMSEYTAQIRFTPADVEDVTATIDERVLVTRLGEWRGMLEEAGL
ncbi:MAG: hypothetical protein R3D45_10765 [Rhizobiaceae bacterium]